MKRSLPSSSSNKRKRQDAFSDSSAFASSTTPQNQADGPADRRGPHAPDPSISNGPTSRSSTSLLNRVVQQRKLPSAKPQGILTFSPMSRLDRTTGRNDASPQTPSKMPRLASPGLPVPTGFALPPPPGSTLAIRAQPGSVKRSSAVVSKSTVGFSPLQSVMSPLSSLGGIGGSSTIGAHSPSATVAKKRTMQPIGQPTLSSTSPFTTASTRGGAQDRPLHVGLPSMPTFSEIAISEDVQSPLGELDGGFTDALSVQDTSRSKGRQNDDRNSLARYLNRLISKQQAASSLFLANLAMSSSHQSHKLKTAKLNVEEPSLITNGITKSSIFSTADMIVTVQKPLLSVQHASPIFECRVRSTSRNLSLSFQSINPADQLLMSFSGNTSSQSGANLQGNIEPNRLAKTMQQIQLRSEPGRVLKEIVAGIWAPWHEVTLDGSDEDAIPEVVLLCSRFVIMEG